MLWLDLNLKRSIAWIFLGNQAIHVKVKGFQLIHLINMVFKFINVDFMVDKIQTFMALRIELIKEVITSQVIQMRKRLKALQV